MQVKQDGLIQKLTRKLMHDVYYPFSACIWLDDAGEILEIRQFDTKYCEIEEWTAPQRAGAVILISNHHDGCMRPFDEDMRNWQRLKAQHPRMRLRLVIYSEDEGVCELSPDRP